MIPSGYELVPFESHPDYIVFEGIRITTQTIYRAPTMTDEEQLELDSAIELAVTSHQGQRDKQGQPYILHPLRVMLSLSVAHPWLMPAAVLHDVLEDTPMTRDDLLASGISERTVGIVEALTRQTDGTQKESYEGYIQRVNRHTAARTVKCAELDDNMKRIDGITDVTERNRLHERYIAALHVLHEFPTSLTARVT